MARNKLVLKQYSHETTCYYSEPNYVFTMYRNRIRLNPKHYL